MTFLSAHVTATVPVSRVSKIPINLFIFRKVYIPVNNIHEKMTAYLLLFFLFLPINNFVVTETIKVTGQLQFICTFIAEYTQHGMLVTIPQCNFYSGIPKIFKVFYASVD